MRRLNRGMGPLNIGKSKARIYDHTQHGKVTFEGMDCTGETPGKLLEFGRG